MFEVLLFILGTCIGSFLNVVIDRIPHGKSIISGRSHCDFCKHVLSWYDLIPIFSFLILARHCRYCKKKLSWQYPFIEFLTGCIFVGVYFLDMPIAQLQFLVFLLDLFIYTSAFALVVMDIKYKILSDKVLLFFAVISLVKIILENPAEIPIRIVVGLVSCLPFFCIFFFSKGRAMGFGDVKLALILGLILGFPVIVIAYYVAFLTGGMTAIVLIIAGKKKLKGSTIAFGPFLFLGWFVGSVYGDMLWKYVGMFLGI